MRIIGTDENLRPLEGKVTIIISLAIFNLNFTQYMSGCYSKSKFQGDSSFSDWSFTYCSAIIIMC